MSVHEYSQAGYAKGTNELYNTARPPYPPQSLSLLRQACLTDPQDIVEIASGTGLCTRALLAHPDWGCVRSLKAIEPSEGMREALLKYTKDDRVEVSNGSFDNTGVETGRADLIVIAHAFHWCLDHEAAAAEFARVLKPGGVLALIWNNEDGDAASWLKQVRERVERHRQGPHWTSALWRQLFDAPSYANHFAPPEERSFLHHVPTTTGGVVDRGLSSSCISTLSEADKEVFVEDVKAIVQKGEGITWIVKETDTFQYPHKIELVTSKRM